MASIFDRDDPPDICRFSIPSCREGFTRAALIDKAEAHVR
jgi:hypothetical protein